MLRREYFILFLLILVVSSPLFAEVVANPDEFIIEDFPTGFVDDRELVLTNNGEQEVQFSLEVYTEDVQQEFNAPGRDSRIDPDEASWFWIDNDEADGPAFEWIDISEIGQQLNAGDDWNSGVLELGFNFPFYGQEFNSIRVGSNGWITLDPEFGGTNIGLPQQVNAGAPNAVFMVNNMDLNPSGVGEMYFWTNEMDMAVVSWDNVQIYGNAEVRTTCQAVFSANGAVKLQYGPQAGVDGSASNVGYESPDGQLGASIIYREADRIHEELCIWIGPEDAWGSWLSVDPMMGSIPANDIAEIMVTFDSQEIEGGEYVGAIMITTSEDQQIEVPVTLSVIGGPAIFSETRSWDFGNVYVGLEAEAIIPVENIGQELLVIESIDSDNADVFYAEDAPGNGWEIAPGDMIEITLYAAPQAGGEAEATLIVNSNAVNHPQIPFPVMVTGLVPPEISVNPNGIEDALNTGEDAEHALTVNNDGGSELIFEIEQVIISEPGRDVPARNVRNVRGQAGPVRDDMGEMIAEFALPNGGANTYNAGLAWDWDNEWMWVSQYRNPSQVVALDPANDYEVAADFQVPAPGNTMGAAWLNGHLYFVQIYNYFIGHYDTEGNNLGNWEIPGQAWRPTAIASSPEMGLLFIEEDTPDAARPIHVLTVDGDGVPSEEIGLIENHNAYHDNVTTRAIAWVDKHPDGQLWISTSREGGGLNAWQIGVNTNTWEITEQVATFPTFEEGNGFEWGGLGHDGHNLWASQYASPMVRLFDDGINEAYWLTFEPTEGQLEPGGETDIFVLLDAAGLIGGDYEADLIFHSNDPVDPMITISVFLSVTGAPDMVVEWPEAFGYPDGVDWNAAYEDLFTGGQYAVMVEIMNGGTEVLTIEDVYSEHNYFSTDVQDAIEVPVHESVEISFFFEAPVDEPGEYAAEMVIESDDPDEPVISISLLAHAFLPPVIEVEPNAIETALATGETEEHDINVANSGDALLRGEVEIVLMGEPERDKASRIVRSVNGFAQNANRDFRGDPDEMGYEWRDNGENDGPDYEWIDITEIGQQLQAGDDWNSGPLAFGWEFEWYGEVYNSVNACSNGWMTLDPDNRSTTINLPQPPNAAAPNPAFCVNNFDLNPSAGGTMYFWTNENDMAVVSWVNVQRYGIANATTTVQAVFMANGLVKYQYGPQQNVNGSDSNVGYESPNGELGASIFYHEADRIAEGLAIGMGPADAFLSWISIDMTEFEIEAGGEQDFILLLNAAGLVEGLYEADVVFMSNDPDDPQVTVSVALDITGAADIVVEWDEEIGYPDVIDWNQAYDDVYVGVAYDVPVMLTNMGTDLLIVSDIFADNDYFSTDFEDEFEIEVDETVEVLLTFMAPVEDAGEFNASFTIISNDPDQEELSIAVHAQAFAPPQIVVTPNAIEEELLTGESIDHAINILNDGDAVLRGTIEIEILGEGQRDQNSRAVRSVLAQRAPAVDQRGEPDEMGYEWRDSDEDDGPEYEWIDITEIGQQLQPGDDWNSGVLAFGWDFEWYGEVYNSLNACSNGWLTLDPNNQDRTIGVPECPNPGNPNPAFCVNNFDLNPSNAGAMYFWTNEQDMAVISWVAVPRFGNAAVITTFQAVFTEDGLVKYQYGPQQAVNGSESNVGYESPDGQMGASIFYREADRLFEGLAIGMGPSDAFMNWISIETNEFMLDPESEVDLILTLDAEGLFEGLYEASVHFLSNDPANPDVEVGVSLDVTGAPDIMVEWSEVAGYPEGMNWNSVYPDLFSGNEYSIPVWVENVGTSELSVDDISSDNELFTAAPDNFVLRAGEGVEIEFILSAEEDGMHEGVMVITSNDPDQGEMEISLSGETASAPVIIIEPQAIEAELLEGDSREFAITVSNEGGHLLRWSVESEIISVPGDERDAGFRAVRSTGPARVINRDRGSEPDDMDYVWRDNDEDGGPEFEWLSIEDYENVQEFNLGDDVNTGAVQLGWMFPLWNREFEQVFIDTDGWVSFSHNDNNIMVDAPNYPVQAEGWRENTIAVFNDDNLAGTDIWFWTNEQNEAIIWWAGDHRFNFQLILKSNGYAVMQYGENIADNTGEIGVNLGDGEHGWYISARDNQYTVMGRAIGFGPSNAWNDWLTWMPDGGELDPGSEEDLIVMLNSEGLIGGDYEAELLFYSNDPVQPEGEVDATVTVFMQVTGQGRIFVEPGGPEEGNVPVDFGTVYIDYPETYMVDVINIGTDILTIEDVVGNEVFYVSDEIEFPIEIGVDEQIVFPLIFDPMEEGEDQAFELLFLTDDLGWEDGYPVMVTGDGYSAPVIVVQPNAIEDELGEGDSAEHAVTIGNEGGSVLTFNTDFDVVSEPNEERDDLIRARNVRSVNSQKQDPAALFTGNQMFNADVPISISGDFSRKAEGIIPAFEFAPRRDEPTELNILLLKNAGDNGYGWFDNNDWLAVFANQDSEPTMADIQDVPDMDLSEYDLVVTGEDQSQALFQSFMENREIFEDYVDGGGLLAMFTGSNGFVDFDLFSDAGDVPVTGGPRGLWGDVNPMFLNDGGDGLAEGIEEEYPILTSFEFYRDDNESPDRIRTRLRGNSLSYSIVQQGDLPDDANWYYRPEEQENTAIVADWSYGSGKVLFTGITGTLFYQDNWQWSSMMECVNLTLWAENAASARWFSWDPMDGDVNPDGEMDIFVTLNAEGLVDGTYEGIFTIMSNDPQTPMVEISVLLDVQGQSFLTADPVPNPHENAESIEFTSVYADMEQSEYPVTLINTGSLDVEIFSIEVAGDHADDFSSDLEQGTVVPARDEVEFLLMFHPVETGVREATIFIQSDAMNVEDGTIWWDVTGIGELPPMILSDHEPGSDFEHAMMLDDEPIVEAMTIGNAEGEFRRDLEFYIGMEEVDENRDALQRSVRSVNLRGNNHRDMRGDTDEAGYFWVDNDDNNGPDFNWIDIVDLNETQVLQAGDDWNSGPLDFGFDMPWYGDVFNSVNVCSNGWLSLNPEDNQNTIGLPQFPDAGTPNPAIGVNNMDLRPANGGGAGNILFWTNEVDMAVVTWDAVAQYGNNNNTTTCQAVFNANGVVLLQYGPHPGIDGSGSNIGYESPDGQLGASIVLREEGRVHDGLAIAITDHELLSWISVEPAEGVVQAGSEIVIEMTFDPSGMEDEADYHAVMTITSNDPEMPEISFDMIMHTGVQMLRHFTEFEMTEEMHLLTINEFTFDDQMVPNGWEIGVFTPDEVLAGGAVWHGAGTELNAYGAFNPGDVMTFRIWDDQNEDVNMEWAAMPAFLEGPSRWNIDGESVISLTSFSSRDITLHLDQLWNMISINVDPVDFYIDGEDRGPDIRTMWAELGPEGDNVIELLKDGGGLFWAPSWDFINIPFWNLTEGYQIKLIEGDGADITFEGSPIQADADIPLDPNWNMIAYFPTYELDASSPDFYVLSPIIEHVILAKDSRGHFLATVYGFSNMAPWMPGQGYQVKIESDEVIVLNYPPEQMEENLAATRSNSEHYAAPRRTNENMSLLINSVEGIEINIEDQIVAYSASGRILGSAGFSGNRAGMAVWGDDNTTDDVEGALPGEAISLRLWDAASQSELELSVTAVHSGSGLVYETDGFSVLDVTVNNLVPDNYYLSQNYPNPFNSVTRIAYGMPATGNLSLRVYDINGRLVQELMNGSVNPGNHVAIWDAKTSPAGIYMVRMETSDGFKSVRKVMLVK